MHQQRWPKSYWAALSKRPQTGYLEVARLSGEPQELRQPKLTTPGRAIESFCPDRNRSLKTAATRPVAAIITIKPKPGIRPAPPMLKRVATARTKQIKAAIGPARYPEKKRGTPLISAMIPGSTSRGILIAIIAAMPKISLLARVATGCSTCLGQERLCR
jgi:hypothetical protein